MIDLTLLRVIKVRSDYKKVIGYIPMDAISDKTKAIIKDFGKYFKLHEEEERIDMEAFRSMFFTTWHKNLGEESTKYYNKVLTRVAEDVTDSIRDNIINQLVELGFATDAANLIKSYQQDEEIDLLREVGDLHDKAMNKVALAVQQEFADFDDATVLDPVITGGLVWPLDVMNESYRPAQGGDQFIIAARPGKGKTSFITFLLWSFCQQLPKNKVFVWFNNESKRQRIMSRQIMSSLNATTNEIKAMQDNGTLRDAYIAAMGSTDRVRVYDVHGKNNFHLEAILESIGEDNVAGIVFDMLDNVKFPTRRDVREDQKLEQLYQWSRELAVKYDCVSLPTSQVSNEGAGLMFPTENMLKDSKTGKQGACDGIIMIGSSDDPLLVNKRGLSMPKEKCKLEGAPHMRAEVDFDSDRGRFK